MRLLIALLVVLFALPLAVPSRLAPAAQAQADTSRVFLEAGEAAYIRTPATGVESVRRRIRAIRGQTAPPVVIVVPPAPGAAAAGGADLDGTVRRLEDRIAALDRTLRRLQGQGPPTVVVLPADADPATLQAYRDSLAGLPGVQLVEPSAIGDVPPAADADVDAEGPPPVVFVEPTPAEVERALLDTGLLRVLGVHFEFDESDLLPAARRTLDAVGATLANNPGLRIVIGGFTDAIGTEAYNQALSERRAASVRAYLVDAFDIDPARLTARGFGENDPIASNANPTGRTLNRRVEFRVIQ